MRDYSIYFKLSWQRFFVFSFLICFINLPNFFRFLSASFLPELIQSYSILHCLFNRDQYLSMGLRRVVYGGKKNTVTSLCC